MAEDTTISRPAYKRHHFGPDSESVNCELCGRSFKIVSISHVRYRHDIDLDEYKSRFPKALLTSEEARERVSEGVSSYYDRRGRRWTPERVKRSVMILQSRREPINARAAFISHKALYEAAYSLFGSWNRALRAAGINPNDVRLNRHWTRHEVLEEIRKHYRSGEFAYGSRLCRRRPALIQAASALFGTWREAIRRAGLEALASPPTRWTRKEVIVRIRRRAKQGNSLIATKVYREDYALRKAAKRLFKEPWPDLIRKLGYKYSGNERWSRKKVLVILRKVLKQAPASHVEEISERNHNNLSYAVRRFFGSWAVALTTAGRTTGAD